jgi:hypothetical protein
MHLKPTSLEKGRGCSSSFRDNKTSVQMKPKKSTQLHGGGCGRWAARFELFVQTPTQVTLLRKMFNEAPTLKTHHCLPPRLLPTTAFQYRNELAFSSTIRGYAIPRAWPSTPPFGFLIGHRQQHHAPWNEFFTVLHVFLPESAGIRSIPGIPRNGNFSGTAC